MLNFDKNTGQKSPNWYSLAINGQKS